jgi:hypothetical protein
MFDFLSVASATNPARRRKKTLQINSTLDVLPPTTLALTGLLQLAAFSLRTVKYWSGFAGDF